jgi:hypothetical protein
MQLIDSLSSSKSLPQPVISSESSVIRNTRTNRAKLAMIWVEESDGNRQRLVARWVTQD